MGTSEQLRGFARAVRIRGASAIERRIGVDPRALAALRISLGLLVLADLLVRSRDLVAFYTDAGVLPRTALVAAYPGLSRLSIHAVSGAAWVQAGLFLTAAVAACAMVVGYRTTLATAISFVLLVSLHARNPVLLNAGDSLLRRLLFWGMFLPLGGRWAVDALGGADRRRRVAGVASAAILLQVVLLYTANGLFKLRGDRWISGDAIRVVFGLDQLTVALGDVLARYGVLLEAFDWLWLALSLSSVLLLLLAGRSRSVLVATFVAMHAGMALTLRLGLFPLISIAGLLAFLPPTVWDAAERRLTGLADRLENAVRDLHPFAESDRGLGRPLDLSSLGTVARWRRRLVPPVVAVLLVLVLVWNAATLGIVDAPDAVTETVEPTEYRWDMFAPDPRTNDGWYVVPGVLESGRQVDAFHRSDLDWDRPPDLADTFPSHRWLVYLVDLSSPANAELRPHFAEYLCRRWNADSEDELVELTVYYVVERVRLDEPEGTNRVELLAHSCGTADSR